MAMTKRAKRTKKKMFNFPNQSLSIKVDSQNVVDEQLISRPGKTDTRPETQIERPRSIPKATHELG